MLVLFDGLLFIACLCLVIYWVKKSVAGWVGIFALLSLITFILFIGDLTALF